MNVRFARLAATTAILMGLGAMISCQQFFTTSLAPFLARDSSLYKIPADLPVADAVVLLDEALASGDAAMAAALVTPLLAAMTAAASDTTSTAYNEAASALVSAVVLSSGVGSIMTEAIAETAQGASPDFAGIIDSIVAVELTENEENALITVAEHIPSDMSSTDAVASALALVGTSSDVEEITSTITLLIEGTATPAIEANPALAAALVYVNYAISINPALIDQFTD